MRAKLRCETGESRALKTYVKLMRATESMTARAHRQLSNFGLTVSQFGVLEALHHLGPMSQSEIGQKILRSSGNMTMVIDNLEKRKLVRRERNQADRRFLIVHLTSEGKELISSIFPSHAAEITREFDVLTPAEQQTLGRLCKKLGLQGRC
jgi:MarR family 2-MHQ and catechol resistance regulon transcriptional repressor